MFKYWETYNVYKEYYFDEKEIANEYKEYYNTYCKNNEDINDNDLFSDFIIDKVEYVDGDFEDSNIYELFKRVKKYL